MRDNKFYPDEDKGLRVSHNDRKKKQTSESSPRIPSDILRSSSGIVSQVLWESPRYIENKREVISSDHRLSPLKEKNIPKIMSFFEDSEASPDFPVIKLTDAPTEGSWSLPTLYKYAVDGSERMWNMSFDEEGERLIMISGTFEGEKTSHYHKIEPKAKRTLQHQAKMEASTRYEKKLREGYATSFDIVNLNYKPMLSQDYDEDRRMSSTVMVQPKLDGQRLTVRIDMNSNGTATLLFASRGSIVYTHITHMSELAHMFTVLGPHVMLDGELYLHGMHMEKIRGIVTKGTNKDKIVSELDPMLSTLEYHIFDYKPLEDIGVIERYENLKIAYDYMIEAFSRENDTSNEANPSNQSKVKLIPMQLVSNHTPEMFYKLRDKYEDQGYEGIMIKQTFIGAQGRTKKTVALYQNGRRVNTIKLKRFDYDWAIVEGVIPSKVKNEICTLSVKDIGRDVSFTLKVGAEEENQSWMKNPELIVGRKIIYKHQGFTDKNGKPRFPTTKADDKIRKMYEGTAL